jgi:hypothetical protein
MSAGLAREHWGGNCTTTWYTDVRPAKHSRNHAIQSKHVLARPRPEHHGQFVAAIPLAGREGVGAGTPGNPRGPLLPLGFGGCTVGQEARRSAAPIACTDGGRHARGGLPTSAKPRGGGRSFNQFLYLLMI